MVHKNGVGSNQYQTVQRSLKPNKNIDAVLALIDGALADYDAYKEETGVGAVALSPAQASPRRPPGGVVIRDRRARMMRPATG